MNVSHIIHINYVLLKCVYHIENFLKTFKHLNISAKPRPFITDLINLSKFMKRTCISKRPIGDWKLWNNGIISCEQPMFLSYKTTENTKKFDTWCDVFTNSAHKWIFSYIWSIYTFIQYSTYGTSGSVL